MDIDLSRLQSKDYIDITGNYDIPKEYYKNSDIVSIDKVDVKGKIYLKENEDNILDYYIECNINGNLKLHDSISLNIINYKYNINYNDFIDNNCKKDKNILDIFEFLWENIVLEVPMQFTIEKDLSKYSGEGWRLVHEDELKNSNNPFSELLKDYEEEE